MGCPYVYNPLIDLLDMPVYGGLYFIYGTFGFVGNAFAISILMRKQMRNNFTVLLAIFMCISMLSQVFLMISWFSALGYFMNIPIDIGNTVHLVKYPLYYFTSSALTFLTIAIVAEQYNTLFKQNGQQRKDPKTVLLFVTPAIILAILVALSRSFDSELNEEYLLLSTQFIKESSFDKVRAVLQLIFVSIVPYTLLIFLHLKIAQKVNTRLRPRIHRTKHGIVYTRKDSTVTGIHNSETGGEFVEMGLVNGPSTTTNGSEDRKNGMSQDEMAAITIGYLWAFYICLAPMILIYITDVVTRFGFCTYGVALCDKVFVLLNSVIGDFFFSLWGFLCIFMYSPTFRGFALCSA